MTKHKNKIIEAYCFFCETEREFYFNHYESDARENIYYCSFCGDCDYESNLQVID